MVSWSITFIYIKIRGIPYDRNYLSSYCVIDCTRCIIQREMASEFKIVYYNYYIMYVDYCFESINNDTPTTLIIIMIITMVGLLKAQPSFLLTKRSSFLNKMTKYLILGVLFTSILAYLSTMPVPIVNGVFLWLTMIAISTCYALLLYMSWSSALGRISTHKQYDLIMVLGAGIFTEKVTPMLAERLNRALSVYQHQTDKCKIIVSGGQGPDEPISEALAMQRYLIQHGVPQSSIIMESQSTNTFENFYYSKSHTQLILK